MSSRRRDRRDHGYWLVGIECLLLGAVGGWWPRVARAELDDLSVSTLEYAAEIEQIRQLKLIRQLRTFNWLPSKISEELERRACLLNPRPGLEEDFGLYRALRVTASGESALSAPVSPVWPRFAAVYFSDGQEPGLVAVARKAPPGGRRTGHWLAVHLAILDQHFGLSNLLQEGNRDRQLALQALAEGDAFVSWLSRASQAWPSDLAARRAWAEERYDQQSGLPSKGTSLSFVERLARERAHAGVSAAVTIRESAPWRAFDDAYRRGLPRSTSQVLHPQWLIEDRQVREVFVTPPAALASRPRPAQGMLGELRARLWLEQWLAPTTAVDAAAGWAGDQVPAVRDQPLR